MQISELTPEVVTPIIRQIVNEFGADYVYKADQRNDKPYEVECAYQGNGKPSCIVGHVLDRVGVPYNPEWDDHGGLFAGEVLDDADVTVRDALTRAQSLQDSGKTWGAALQAYEEYIGDTQ